MNTKIYITICLYNRDYKIFNLLKAFENDFIFNPKSQMINENRLSEI